MTLNVAFYDKISILLPQLWMHFVSGNFLLNRIFRNWLKSTLTLEISSLTVLCLAKMPIIVKFAKLKPGLKIKKNFCFSKFWNIRKRFNFQFQPPAKIFGANWRPLLRFSHNQNSSVWNGSAWVGKNPLPVRQTCPRDRYSKIVAIQKNLEQAFRKKASLSLRSVQFRTTFYVRYNLYHLMVKNQRLIFRNYFCFFLSRMSGVVGTAHSCSNPNATVWSSKGIWFTYSLLIILLHFIILSIPG